MVHELNVNFSTGNFQPLKAGKTTVNGKKVDLANILAHYSANNPNAAGGKEPDVIGKSKYTYKGQEGTLVKYSDGSVEFHTKKGKNICVLHFDNERDLGNKKPDYQLVNPNNPKTKQVITYKYHSNGQKALEVRKNAQGKVTSQIKYNKEGKVTENTNFDARGKLKNRFEYTYDTENNTRIAKKYNNKNKLEEFVETKYDDKNKAVSSNTFFPDGKLKAETTYWDTGNIRTQTTYDNNGKVVGVVDPEVDGYFGPSSQVSEGDCYLLAAINGVRGTAGGQEALNNLVTVTTNSKGEKLYTVTLPGAKLAAQGLNTDSRIDKDKMYITGTYTFTEAEFLEIQKQAGKKYSLGDGDVMLLEAAFEQYRIEVDKTMEANNINSNMYGIAGLQTGQHEDNILAGGQTVDAMFILTGKKSQVYIDRTPDKALDYDALKQGKLDVVSPNNGIREKAAISQIDGPVVNAESNLDRMLNGIMRDGADGQVDNVASASFKVAHSDGTVGGHAFTIKSVTADTVVLINPWHPNEELVMSREEFKASVTQVTVASEPIPAPPRVSQNAPNKLTALISNIVNNGSNQNNGINQSQMSSEMKDKIQQFLNAQVNNQTQVNTNQNQPAPQKITQSVQELRLNQLLNNIIGQEINNKPTKQLNEIVNMLKQQGLEVTPEAKLKLAHMLLEAQNK